MFDKLLSWLREKARLWFGEDTPISVSVSAPHGECHHPLGADV